MNYGRFAATLCIIAGLGLTGYETVQNAPWGFGLVLGIIVAFLGAVVLSDDAPEPPRHDDVVMQFPKRSA